jgi:hypothetical protein
MSRYQNTCSYETLTGLAGSAVFKSFGSCTWKVPANVKIATFEVWGGGGGGAGRCCCDCYRNGPSGSGGGYAKLTIPVTPAATYSLCVGAGGGSCSVGSGSASLWCCYGGAGTTSYVTGTNINVLCATGGDGGYADCYYHCGCSVPTGLGYACTNLDYAGTEFEYLGLKGHPARAGGYGWAGGDSGSDQCGASWAGGAGTFALQPWGVDACCFCMCGKPCVTPGRGGQTYQSITCCQCGPGSSGVDGMVRITY